MAVHLSEESRADYSDYLKRFQEDPQSISAEEAAQRYQELVRQAPPELAAEANQQVMGLLPQNEREVLATNIQGSQGEAQNFGLLDRILGKDSVLNTPLGKMILSAVVAYLMKRMLGQQDQAGTRAPTGGLGDLISTILTSAAAAQAQGRNQAPGQVPTGGLEDILGALMGGQAQAGGGQLPTGQAPAGGLGDLLGSILSGQAQPGGQMPAGQVPSGGLGDLLGSILSGQAQSGNRAPTGGLEDILGALMGGESADMPEAPRTDPDPEQPPVRSHRKQ
jgi:hypothetical protein